ncbi:MAG: hypothetical protein AB1497_08795 [Bacillota bacterium]
MARYYTESASGRLREVIAQDDSGVLSGALYSRENGQTEIRTAFYYPKDDLWIKLPEWQKPRKVSTTSRDYLDFVRRCERGPYTATTPSEIMERPGSAEEVILAVFEAARPDVA